MKASVCAIIKNEHKYLKEWIEYYLQLGFDEVCLGEDFDSKSHQHIVDEINSDKVKLIKLSEVMPDNSCNKCSLQIRWYDTYFQDNKNKFDWIAFFDIDEFLVLEKETLQEFLSDYEMYEGVSLAWKYYNASGHIKTPMGNVMDSYTTYLEEAPSDCQVKTIVNCHKAKKIIFMHASTHNCVDVFKNFSFKSSLLGCKMANKNYWKRAWINHYFTKSWEDWVQRMIRGNMANNYRTLDTFFDYNPEMKPLQRKLTLEAAKVANTFSNTKIYSRKFSLYNKNYVRELKDSFLRRIGFQ